MLAGLALGLAIAGALYLRSAPPARPAAATTPAAAPTQSSASAPPEAPPAQKPPSVPAEDATQYDFYKILPSFEVVVPEPESTRSSDGPVPAITDPGHYVLQAGSYTTHEDADRQQASLALLGVEAQIQTGAINDDVFYRVRIGPIDDLDELNRVRQRLREAHVDVLLLKVP
jgi:cell division protein FtsN